MAKASILSSPFSEQITLKNKLTRFYAALSSLQMKLLGNYKHPPDARRKNQVKSSNLVHNAIAGNESL